MASVGYKACKNNRIVELEPLGRNNETREKIYDADYAQMRCESARVIRIYEADTNAEFDAAESIALHRNAEILIYQKGAIIKSANGYDENIDATCTNGIHYFRTLEPALNYAREYMLSTIGAGAGTYQTYNPDGRPNNIYHYENGKKVGISIVDTNRIFWKHFVY